jgi:two-component system phosphate regulon sensor histidine kinase PhoR
MQLRMRNRIFRRYFWIGFLLFSVTLFVIDCYVIRYAWLEATARIQAQLETNARVLAGESGPFTDAWVKSAAQRSGLRLAVLNGEGAVVADSAPQTNTPLSVIVPLAAGQPGWILRVSSPIGAAEARISRLRWWLVDVSLLSLALGLILTLLFMRSFTRRVNRLRTYIEGLPDAVLPDQELPGGNDELGALAQALRRSAPKIRELVGNLQVESTRREAILSSMVEGVLAVDHQLRVTFCNKSFARIVGYRMPVPEGVPLLELVRDPTIRDLLVTVLQSGQPVERKIQLRGQQEHSFEVQAAPFAGASTRGALAILHDITELERLERVRKDFVANVSHELRTPLAAIRGYAETLLDGALEDQENNHRFIEIILAHAIRLNNIASDLLVLSELESNSAQAAAKRLSIRVSVESALRTVESSARLRGIKLLAGPIEDLYVLGYEIRLEQAFINLLDNAVKFNWPNGEVRIEAVDTGNGRAAITITDTGVGIPSDDLPRIFERFYRVDKARSRAVGGTGLGLSIVKHVIEQMGGSIRVESELGKGTRFTVLLPVAEMNVPAAVIVS